MNTPPDPPRWIKSSRSGGNGHCVEIASAPSTRLLRDSKLGDRSPILRVTPTAFTVFVNAVRSGEFD